MIVNEGDMGPKPLAISVILMYNNPLKSKNKWKFTK